MENQNLIYGFQIARMTKDGRVKIPIEFIRSVVSNSKSSELVVRFNMQSGCVEACDTFTDCASQIFFRQQAVSCLDEHVLVRMAERSRMMFGGACKIEIGMDNKLALPSYMARAAALDDYVVLLGTGDGFEVWNPNRLHARSLDSPVVRQLVAGHVSPADLLPASSALSQEVCEVERSIENSEAQAEFDDPAPNESFVPEAAKASDPFPFEDSANVFYLPLLQAPRERGITLFYSRKPPRNVRPAKAIVYATPVYTLLDSQWIIVVERTMLPDALTRAVTPLWRSIAEGGDECDTRTDDEGWRPMREWPEFSSADRNSAGLPGELKDIYQTHRHEIDLFADPDRKAALDRRWFSKLFDSLRSIAA